MELISTTKIKKKIPKRVKMFRKGEINYNKNGSRMEIIEYYGYDNVLVKFDCGFIIKTAYKCFKSGGVTNVYDKTSYDIGYMGEGQYVSQINGESTTQYGKWKGMLERCYDEKRKKLFPTYIGCTVCEEWHNFQNFAKWYDENYYEVDEEVMCLDKDILNKGNKIYSPETCIFAPNNINVMFTKSDAIRGECPIGVSYHKRDEVFQAGCSIFDDNTGKKGHVYLGYHSTPELAFNAYKTFKESYIKQVADKYKSQIPDKLYQALYSYIVEITD